MKVRSDGFFRQVGGCFFLREMQYVSNEAFLSIADFEETRNSVSNEKTATSKETTSQTKGKTDPV